MADFDDDFYGQNYEAEEQEEISPPEEEYIELEDTEKVDEGETKTAGLVISRRPKVLTPYQYSKILGLRTEEVQSGKPIYIKIKKGEKLKPIDVAAREIALKKLPYVIKITYPDRSVEYHYLKDTIIPRNIR